MNLQENIRKVLREETNNPKDNPVKYYYYNYLNKEPIEFKGLYLVPKWTGELIKWKVDNPNDYSYSKEIITQVLREEFNSFCDMTNTDSKKYEHYATWMENIPNNCYISKEDKKHLKVNGNQIKQINFSGILYRYEFDFDYKSTDVTSHQNEVGVYVYGNITNLRKTNLTYDEKTITEKPSPLHFVSDMSDYDYDEWKESLYNILHPMKSIFQNNPRFFDDDYDFFELNLQQTT